MMTTSFSEFCLQNTCSAPKITGNWGFMIVPAGEEPSFNCLGGCLWPKTCHHFKLVAKRTGNFPIFNEERLTISKEKEKVKTQNSTKTRLGSVPNSVAWPLAEGCLGAGLALSCHICKMGYARDKRHTHCLSWGPDRCIFSSCPLGNQPSGHFWILILACCLVNAQLRAI